MPLDATNFTSPRFIDKVDQTFPKFKELRENRKVKIVALHVFKGLVCVALGAGLGALSCTLIGAPMFLAIGVGAAGGALIYFAVASVHSAIQAIGFPANNYLVTPSLPKDSWSSDEDHQKFINVLTKIAKLDCFQEWLTQEGLTPQEGASRLWKDCQKGLCQGQSQALISIMEKHHDLHKRNLLGKLKAKEIFKRQIFELIRSDMPDNQEIADLANNIPGIEPSFHMSFSKSDLKSDSSLLFNELIDAKNALVDDYQVLCATIRLQNADEAHTIFVELHPTYRIYDSSSHLYTGLYEGFKTEKRFLKALQRHIQGYQSSIRPNALKYDEIIIRGHVVDQPKLREAALTAKAGAIPI